MGAAKALQSNPQLPSTKLVDSNTRKNTWICRLTCWKSSHKLYFWRKQYLPYRNRMLSLPQRNMGWTCRKTQMRLLMTHTSGVGGSRRHLESWRTKLCCWLLSGCSCDSPRMGSTWRRLASMSAWLIASMLGSLGRRMQALFQDYPQRQWTLWSSKSIFQWKLWKQVGRLQTYLIPRVKMKMPLRTWPTGIWPIL